MAELSTVIELDEMEDARLLGELEKCYLLSVSFPELGVSSKLRLLCRPT